LKKYIIVLKNNALKLNEKEDEINWLKSKCSKNYTTKLGYIVKMEEDEVGEKKWWWKKMEIK
jgi:hypothetical protein